jgi:hypothetical protein
METPMIRFLSALLAVLALSVATPATACDCHGDCASCPHRVDAAKGSDAKAASPKGAPACACREGKACTCEKGCKCASAPKPTEKAAAPAPGAPAGK